jgi:4,5-DOPA dioxygenase extradiol
MPNIQNQKLPVLFIGHGSPMNALEVNDYTRMLQTLSMSITQPKVILCISAHWLTEGTWLTHMGNPKTIHDFYGFPRELFDIIYPAPGSPETAELVKSCITTSKVQLDDISWGLDHGTWAIMRHIYPDANIPVVQLSIDINQPAQYHYQIGQQLRVLRNQGVLIIGSGNIVHNLAKIIWHNKPTPYDWAIEFDDWVKNKILNRDISALTMEYKNFIAGQLSVPTSDHYFPLMYALGAMDDADKISFIFEEIQNGSISMRSICFG